MNAYFFNPRSVDKEKLPLLLNILKVQRVIDLRKAEDLNDISSAMYPNKVIFERGDLDVEKAIELAVYKFNEPLCRPEVYKGRNTGEMIVNTSIYDKSIPHNPIYNLEHCNDDNVIIFYSSDLKFFRFINYSTNIIRKYSEEEGPWGICYVHIGEFLTWSSIVVRDFYETAFKRLYRSWTNFENYRYDTGRTYNIDTTWINTPHWEAKDLCEEVQRDIKRNFYDPILSYINMRAKQLIPNSATNVPLYDLFLSQQGRERLEESVVDKYYKKIEEIRQEIYDSNDYDYD